jgi:predicted HAD superfamily Cof-like phosphohydrolase
MGSDIISVRDWYADVLAFHRALDCFICDRPAYPGAAIHNLRVNLIIEEWNELARAVPSADPAAIDIPAMADAIVDLIYVLIGMALAYGLDIRPIWDAVHRANMVKVGGGKREDGKIMKPPGWVAPDVAGLLRQQGWDGMARSVDGTDEA